MSIDLGVPRGKEIGRESCSVCFLSAFIFDLLVGAPSGCSVLWRCGLVATWYGAFQCWVGLRVCWGERAGAGAGFSPSFSFPGPPGIIRAADRKRKYPTKHEKGLSGERWKWKMNRKRKRPVVVSRFACCVGGGLTGRVFSSLSKLSMPPAPWRSSIWTEFVLLDVV